MADTYCRTILDVLQLRKAGLDTLPANRHDWEGPSVLLDMYANTSGKSRTEFIRAIGQILGKEAAPANVLAQLVDIASALDIAEVESEVQALGRTHSAAQEPLKNAITNYLAYRQLRAGSRQG